MIASRITLSVLSIVLLATCDNSVMSKTAHETVNPRPESTGPVFTAVAEGDESVNIRTLNWDNLLPDDFQPGKLLEVMKGYDVDKLSDDDPRAQELMEKLKVMWKEAPVVNALNDQTVKLPGFVVPLEGDGRVVLEFLLVPYYGACIHVPPPPANQMVYVKARGSNAQVRRLFDAVWVTGVMKVERASSEHGEAGYTLTALEVAPYEE